MSRDPNYALDQHQSEYERLGRQAARDNGLTERLFRAAGIGTGMRVLDVGCGAGHVSSLVASLVGPTGSVVGIDREASVLEYARAHAPTTADVSFVLGDFRDDVARLGMFDAVVGRYVLQYQGNPLAAVSVLANCVRPKGVLAFVEVDIPSRYAAPGMWPESDLAHELGQLLLRVWHVTGTQLRMGARLPSLLGGAGLNPSPQLLTEAMVGVGAEGAELMVGLLRSMESVIRENQLADFDALDLGSAVERLLQDVPPPGPISMGPVKVGAWATRPA